METRVPDVFCLTPLRAFRTLVLSCVVFSQIKRAGAKATDVFVLSVIGT